MTLSRRATFAAASLLSAVIAIPTAALADNQSPPANDKDKKHGEHRSNDHGDKKEIRRGGQPYTGNAPQPGKQPPARGFTQTPPPKRPAAEHHEKQKPPAKPPVINAAPKATTPPAKTLSKDRAPEQFKRGDHRKPDGDHARGDDNKMQRPGSRPDRNQANDNDNKTQRPVSNPDRSRAGDNDNRARGSGDNRRDHDHAGDRDNQRPGGKPPAVNPTTNPAPNSGGAYRGQGHDARNNLPRPPSAADARKRFDNLRKSRTEKVEGNRTFIKEGDRTIVKQNNRYVIQHDERDRLRRLNPNARFERRNDGTNIAVIERPGNVKIYSETDSNGRLLRRYRRGPDGRDVTIIDNRRRGHGHHRDHGGPSGKDIATGIGIGIGVAAGAAILNSVLDVPPPRVSIPRDRYIVEYDGASDEDVYDALSAPPVEDLRERYTLDEVRATATLRDRMRRVDLDDINFEFGSWEVDPSEYNKLERVARAMKRVIRGNPNEVFMIEGYTDAVGSPEDNLSLSDRRAESVAEVLTEEFDVPFENLVTQGYGEDYLKVNTEQPERLNRRVAVRRITPLLARGGD